MVDFDRNAFKEKISNIESKGDYRIINKSGSSATGKYQFIWSQWGDRIMAQTGVESQDDFLDNPKAQEAFMDYLIEKEYIPSIKTLRKYNAEESSKYTDAQLVALLHFQGLPNAKKFFDTGTTANAANNTSVKEYLTSFADMGDVFDNTSVDIVPAGNIISQVGNAPIDQVSDFNTTIAPQDYGVHGENTKVDTKITPLPTSIPNVNTSFTGQGQNAMFNKGGNLFVYGGPVKPYVPRSVEDHAYRKGMYEDSLSLYNAYTFQKNNWKPGYEEWLAKHKNHGIEQITADMERNWGKSGTHTLGRNFANYDGWVFSRNVGSDSPGYGTSTMPSEQVIIDKYKQLIKNNPSSFIISTGSSPDLWHKSIKPIGTYRDGDLSPIYKKPVQEIADVNTVCCLPDIGYGVGTLFFTPSKFETASSG